ncbi:MULTISPECIES: type II toxin-antitoxin system HipA family toxin [Methylosinus]|uniref:Type II toxin-antitoxin system HipA family toxin n=1 Tax=Methylosinus trichosporium (strain ATCC 35070 / NCIMB 11131 / UNIQEM 75 / OB3b) TaxID=595536 RepID=A0A2D2D1V1_METT3|nr:MULTISPECIES: type II toxin-antitoxin system HipA family toxin [Methylosinus]ATQ68960.1 type II toxin-antitoxin system HipA family toxin [Methylosinus trichosporium OB3b]OBS50393.1 serine/threonine protein kinase [Methylosinus sp. 3S-1]
MTAELLALANGRKVGRVIRDPRGRLAFIYEETWRAAQGAYPLSLSMPLTAEKHGHQPIDAFLWGLLPDNEAVLARWARRFQVSARNPFALLSHVGEDCAGAVQFVRPDRVDAILGEEPGAVEWLNEADIAERLRTLRADHAAWRTPSDTGQFSLAGAQPKTALLCENGRWGVPSGRTPTTHILKPPTGEYDGHAENEHLCMSLASRLGLLTARSRVQWFGDEVAIVIERYDRDWTDSAIIRVHQEDFCQALAIPPTRKYENEGGPGARMAVDLLRTVSGRPQEDVQRFVDAIIFNWLIAGTDAHAKNYSLLIGAQGRARLAPLYDIASILPYGFDPHRVRLAMKIGDTYKLRDIGAPQWRKFAGQLRLNADEVLHRIREMAAMLPDHLADVRRAAESDGIAHSIVARLSDALTERADRCRQVIGEL